MSSVLQLLPVLVLIRLQLQHNNCRIITQRKTKKINRFQFFHISSTQLNSIRVNMDMDVQSICIHLNAEHIIVIWILIVVIISYESVQ
ncbi:hypothetical protein V1511DRAFT_491226 [Dipodascopsis uninucleata]